MAYNNEKYLKYMLKKNKKLSLLKSNGNFLKYEKEEIDTSIIDIKK